jgi:hypothetical protein
MGLKRRGKRERERSKEVDRDVERCEIKRGGRRDRTERERASARYSHVVSSIFHRLPSPRDETTEDFDDI